MDILKPIKEQIDIINKLNGNLELNTILLHIERAHYFFEKGKTQSDSQYYTDVIYRTNQAFEGCSRQAYMILAEKTKQKTQNTRAYDIEEYFSKNNILNDRVLPQFKNYRDNWRNEAAHNFNLFFNEEEAYFAIVNVLSYAYVLFNQMIYHISSKIEKEKIRKEEIQLKRLKSKLRKQDITLKEKVIELIKFFDKENQTISDENGEITGYFTSEIEILGKLTTYLREMLPPPIIIESEKRLGNYRADIYIEHLEDKIILELKRYTRNTHSSITGQIAAYLDVVGGVNGIGYIFTSSEKFVELQREDFKIEESDKIYDISILSRQARKFRQRRL